MFCKLHILFAALALLVAGTSAIPHRGRAPVWTTHTLRACEDAINCEVVNGHPVIDHAFTRSFLAKRDGTTSNKTSIVANQGIVDASNCVPGDIVKTALGNHCTAAGCTTDSQAFQCPPQPQAGIAGLKDQVTCTVTQDGAFVEDSEDLKSMFVDVLQAAARAHTTQKSHSVSTIQLGRREAAHFGGNIKFNTNAFPQSIEATHTVTINGQSALSGHVRYTVECHDSSSGVCSAILNNVGAILGMLVPETKAIAGAIEKAC